MKKIIYKSENAFLKIMLKNTLDDYGFDVMTVDDDEEMFETLKNGEIDLVIYNIGTEFPANVFEQISELYPETKMTVTTHANVLPFYEELTKFNMLPCITKPLSEPQMIKSISHHLLEEGEKLKMKLGEKDLSKFMYKHNEEGNIEGIHFEYKSDDFFVIFEYENNEISDVSIQHHNNIIFQCGACGGHSTGMEECPEFSKRQNEIIEILFNIEQVKNKCEELIPKWENYKKIKEVRGD